MAKILRLTTDQGSFHKELAFMCPGCNKTHIIYDKESEVSDTSLEWDFNGDYENPTLSPSVLINGSSKDSRCHSFIIEGKIKFLPDCNHGLRNKIVELPEINWEIWQRKE